jgi:hypothetical protein
MKRIIIAESEKEDIMKQHNELKPLETRHVLDMNITSLDLIRYKEHGVKPYYFNSDESSPDFGLIEITKPFNGYDKFGWDKKPKRVYLLTPEEFDKVNALAENTREMIELSKQKISLLKDLIKGSMYELTKDK